MVERDLAKVEVAGSIPVIRSKADGYDNNVPITCVIKYPKGYLLIYVEPKRV